MALDLDQHLELYSSARELSPQQKANRAKTILDNLGKYDQALTEDEGLVLLEILREYQKFHAADWEVKEFLQRMEGRDVRLKIEGRAEQELVEKVIKDFRGKSKQPEEVKGPEYCEELVNEQRYQIEEVLMIAKPKLLMLAKQLKNWQEGYKFLKLKGFNVPKCFLDFAQEKAILLFQGDKVVILKKDYHKFMDSLDQDSDQYQTARMLSADMTPGGPFLTMFKELGYEEGQDFYQELLILNDSDHTRTDNFLREIVHTAFPEQELPRQ